MILCWGRVVAAADQPISGAKLTLRRSSSGKERLVFVSTDPLFLKQGKRIKVTARDVLLPLVGPQGGVGIPISTGSLRNCALFGPATIRHDEAGRFDAADAPVPGFPNCAGVLPNTSTTFGTTTTTSTTSTTLVLAECTGGSGFSTCDGTCAGTDTCQPSVAFVRAVRPAAPAPATRAPVRLARPA